MRLDNYEGTYQDHKDTVQGAFHLMKREKWTAEDCTNYIVGECGDEMESTCLAMWMIAMGTKEIELGVLEKRVHDQLCYHVPAYQRGEYDDELRPEEKELMDKDVEYILANVEMYEVHEIED